MVKRAVFIIVILAAVVVAVLPIPVLAAMPSAGFYITSVTVDTVFTQIQITDDGGAPCYAKLAVFRTSDYVYMGEDYQTGFTTGQSFYGTVSGLSASTSYFCNMEVGHLPTSDQVGSGSMYFDTLSGLTTPTISISAATNVEDVTATLNGSITDTGGATTEIRWGYGTTSKTAGNFGSYDTVTGWEGSYDYPQDVSKNIAPLTAGLTYYFRFQAQNSEGYVTSGEESFITWDYPSINSVAASNVAKTTAKLNSLLVGDGGTADTIEFAYGAVSHTVGDYALYTYHTAVSGTFTTGGTPYLNVASLSGNTDYYFRVKATNSLGSTISTSEQTFKTPSGVGTPTNLLATNVSNGIKLVWVMGSGASQSLVRVKLGSYPTSETDGDLVYLGASTTTTYTDVTSGTNYYFSVWGESGGAYSAGHSDYVITAQVSGTGGGGGTMGQPWNFITGMDYTNLHNFEPVYGILNGVADTLNMPRATFWLLLAMAASAVVAALAGYRLTSGIIGFAAGMIVMVFCWGVRIVPGFIALAWVLWGLPILWVKGER